MLYALLSYFSTYCCEDSAFEAREVGSYGNKELSRSHNPGRKANVMLRIYEVKNNCCTFLFILFLKLETLTWKKLKNLFKSYFKIYLLLEGCHIILTFILLRLCISYPSTGFLVLDPRSKILFCALV